MTVRSLENVLVPRTTSIRQAMEKVTANASGIVIVVDDEGRLEGTVTDGDIRRSILRGNDLAMTVAHLIAQEEPGPAGGPVVAPADTSHDALLEMMRRYHVRHIPLLDADRRVVGLVRLEDLIDEPDTLRAVVMAGGFGTRLRPLTDTTPKPLLQVGDRPLIEHILGQLHAGGVRHVSVTTHYKPEVFKEQLGDGGRFGVAIDYLTEDAPLGTAGALGMMPPWESTLLVINGDVLTRANYRAMLDFHRQHRAVLTVGARQYEVQVPYGVIEADGVTVQRINEKPTLRFFVNAGVYLLEPRLHARLTGGKRLDMTDLIQDLTSGGERVVTFPISEYWLDVGQLPDYQQAQADIANGRY